MNTWDMDLHFDQEVVFAHVDQVYVGCPSITCGVANDGRFIRMHECGHLFEQQVNVEVGESSVYLPAVFGTITDNYLLALQAPANQGKGHWEFMEAPDVTTALTTNNCSIGGAESYRVQDVEILGTGNGETLLRTLNLWIAGPAGGPPGGAVGYLESMDFAAAGGQEIVGSFVLGEDFIPGRDLEIEWDYSSDAAAASTAEFTTDSALFRPGVDTDVNPPTNINQDAANAIPESAPVDEFSTTQRFEVTDGAGDINGIEPAVGDTIAVKLARDAGDPSAAVFRVYLEARVYMREA